MAAGDNGSDWQSVDQRGQVPNRSQAVTDNQPKDNHDNDSETVRFFIFFSLCQLYDPGRAEISTACIIRTEAVIDFIGRISEPYGYLKALGGVLVLE